MKTEELRKKYPKFIYKNYSYRILKKDLQAFFVFEIPPGIRFSPEIRIKNIPSKINLLELDNLVFHAGLAEIPSYWKSTCSPEIEIKAGCLEESQINWWEEFFIKGLGQFFYENKIDWRKPNFLKISAKEGKANPISKKLKKRYLVPFAGGRDSIVTLESLKKKRGEEKIALFTVNPIGKIKKTAEISGIKKQIEAERKIDKKILSLNKKGYLNGHTPFTSVLSFLAVLCAAIFDYKYIAFSNEKSSNEGNVKYLGKEINHQWAKSSEFEKMFKKYLKEYLLKEADYSSYLRNRTELEISKIFSRHKKYFPYFSSCNANMKINKRGDLAARKRWCCNCLKCLFVYISLYPFLEKGEIKKIFGQDLFEKKSLLPLLRKLADKKGIKPMECVGTKKETKKALDLCVKKAKKEGDPPYLLTKYLAFRKIN